MDNYQIREATINDIDFIIEAIIEAEKSGSEILSYSTVFNLTETEVREILRSILMEEMEGCEFSLVNYLIAFKDDEPAGTIGAWVEKKENPSSIIKSSLLGYYLPRRSIEYAAREAKITSDLIIEHTADALSLVVVYIAPLHRGKNLFSLITNEHIRRHTGVDSLSIQVMANNIKAIRSYEKYGFRKSLSLKSDSELITKFLPYNEKVLMTKTIDE